MRCTKGQNELRIASRTVAKHLREWRAAFSGKGSELSGWADKLAGEIDAHDWYNDPTGMSTQAIAVIRTLLNDGLRPVTIAGYILGSSYEGARHRSIS